MTTEQRAQLVAAISGYLYNSDEVLEAPDDAAEAILRMVERALAPPPVPKGDITIDYRVSWTQWAMDTLFPDQFQEDPENLTDLLANLMHWASARQVSFSRSLGLASSHYMAEKIEAEAGWK